MCSGTGAAVVCCSVTHCGLACVLVRERQWCAVVSFILQDVAARGLDLPHVDWIVQFTAPSTAGDYVHRVGRTARVGTAGASLLFLAPSEVQFIRWLEDRRIR